MVNFAGENTLLLLTDSKAPDLRRRRLGYWALFIGFSLRFRSVA